MSLGPRAAPPRDPAPRTAGRSASGTQSAALGKVRSAGRQPAAHPPRAAARSGSGSLPAGGPAPPPLRSRRGPQGAHCTPRASILGVRDSGSGRPPPPPSRGPAARTAGAAAHRGEPRPPMACAREGPRGRFGRRGLSGSPRLRDPARGSPHGPAGRSEVGGAGECGRARGGGGGGSAREARAGQGGGGAPGAGPGEPGSGKAGPPRPSPALGGAWGRGPSSTRGPSHSQDPNLLGESQPEGGAQEGLREIAGALARMRFPAPLPGRWGPRVPGDAPTRASLYARGH